MEGDRNQLEALLPNIAAQMRGALSNLHLAAAQLVPAAQREQDPDLDARAALLDQSYYQLLRLAGNLSAAAMLQSDAPLSLQDGDIVEAVSSLCEQTASLAELAGVHLSFRCAMDHHVCAFCREGDEQLLFQLLSNAVKFTPQGGSVTVELKCAGGKVLLSVADTGCGMEPEQLETLFDRYRSGNPMVPVPHGLGLGLALCQRVAQGHGGSLMAESHLGQGSRFTVSIPDRQCGITEISDVRFDYSGGFNRALLALSDALPARAFLLRNQD